MGTQQSKSVPEDRNRQDDEDWSYRRAGAPPSEYTRETRGRFYLPKVSGLTFGSEPVLLERVREEFWPWSLFQPGSPNLSRHRTVSGWVVYDNDLTNDAGLGMRLKDRTALASEYGLKSFAAPEIATLDDEALGKLAVELKVG